jgi:hypothetical protein
LTKKRTESPAPGRRKAAKSRRPNRPTLAELNAWITANHDALLRKARANSIRLTGKPTFGGTSRKMSA